MAHVVEQQTEPQIPYAANNTISGMDQEQDDPQGEKSMNRETGMRRYFRVDISTQNADLLLLTCCLISGLMDSTIYEGMVSCCSCPLAI